MEVQSRQNICWPIRIDELHNRVNVLEVDKKADDLKQYTRSYSPKLFKRFVVKLCFPISLCSIAA